MRRAGNRGTAGCWDTTQQYFGEIAAFFRSLAHYFDRGSTPDARLRYLFFLFYTPESPEARMLENVLLVTRSNSKQNPDMGGRKKQGEGREAERGEGGKKKRTKEEKRGKDGQG